MATPKKKIVEKAEIVSLEQLYATLETKQKDLLEAKRSNAAGELVNPRVITTTRKEIARTLTAIRAEQLKSVSANASGEASDKEEK